MASAWLPATPAEAIVAMRWLAAIAVALGTLELWRVRGVADDDGVWRWSTAGLGTCSSRNARMRASGRAPTNSATTSPPANSLTAGMLLIWYRPAIAGC